MPNFEPGHSIGTDTRFKPGQSGNPAGRPRGLATIARAVLAEATAEGSMTKAEALMRRLPKIPGSLMGHALSCAAGDRAAKHANPTLHVVRHRGVEDGVIR